MKLGTKITKLYRVDLDGYKVKLGFSTGEKGTVSLDYIFGIPKNLATEVLKGGMFEKCFLEGGALAWPNGLELCPDSLYQKFQEQKANSAA